MNHDVLKYLLVIHAFCGCDTTSGIHEKGKNAVLKLVTKSKKLQRSCDTNMSTDANQDDVGQAGLDIFIELYGGKGM